MKFMRFSEYLAIALSFILPLPGFGFAQEIPFRHVIIDAGTNGHREVGDIDRDGYNDIVAVNDPDDQFAVVWYRYPEWKKYTIATWKGMPYRAYRADDMEIADLDNDGDVDIAGRIGIPENDPDGVIIWFENPGANSLFHDAVWKYHTVGESQYIKDFEIRDFDGDGNYDIAARENTRLHIFIRSADDSWHQVQMGIHDHEGMEAGDIDGDGDPDIILNGFWLENPANPRRDVWVEHNIDEKWWNQRTPHWTDNNCKVSAGDINQDGCLDVLLAQSEKAGYPVSWYEAPANPKTDAWHEHIIGYLDKCHNLKAADFDNDGDLDILTGEIPNIESEAPHPVSIFINQGIAHKWRRQKLAEYGNYSAQVGDIDNDGDIDIIGLRNYNRPPIEMWRNLTSDRKLNLDSWRYIHVDSTRSGYAIPGGKDWWRYFGLAMGDLTRDGFADIVSGKYFYRNPGADMTDGWERINFPVEVDAMLILDVDGDPFGDVIGQALPDIYWLEARDDLGSSWSALRIGSMSQTSHGNAQSYAVAQMVRGGKREIVLGDKNGVSYFVIPDDPGKGVWNRIDIASQLGEFAVGDVDGDQIIDIAGSDCSEGEKNQKIAWWRNAGDGTGNWRRENIGVIDGYFPDRIAVADINGDGLSDVVVTEEEQPVEPRWKTYWFEQSVDNGNTVWRRHVLVTQYTTNSMDVADFDRDGDIDIITGEHRGLKELSIWENDGKGSAWQKHLVDSGRENHLGARVFDLDGDGDLDIVGICWDSFRDLHIWRNDAIPCGK